MNNQHKSHLDHWIVSTLILFVLLSIVVLLWRWLPFFLAEGSQVENSGEYGDTYGSVNALFTGLAFAALIFTIFLQFRAIKLQRADFLETMNEMKSSRQQVAKQASIQERQLLVSLTELRMKIFEAEIAEIKLKNHAKISSDIISQLAENVAEVREKMSKAIVNLQAGIDTENRRLEDELKSQPVQ